MINKLSIPNPCHENWNGMTPDENGRFCGSCQKIVIDFTTKTEQEIIDYFAANAGKRTCGKFKTTQLNQPKKIPFQNQHTLKFVAALLLVFGMTLFSCNPYEKPVPPPQEEQHLTGVIISPLIPADSSETSLPKDTTAKTTPTKKRVLQFTPPEIIKDSLTEESTLTGDVIFPGENLAPTSDTNEVFTIVEQMPEFPGGTTAMMKYIQANLQYPETAKDIGISGTTYITFVVRKDGSIDNVEVLRGVESSFDKEAIRVVKSMPRWTPGKNQGRKVNVRFNLPVKINLR
ncbi:MAG: hypothetical protein JWP12_2844 [Bacteroidetes bacterium]|nr:hypothetical protein [Bacteroidota bacterium]